MDEMDTSPNDSAADDQSGTAMTGNAFDHAIQQDATLSSGSGFPDEAASQRPPLQSLPPDATPFQYDNVNYSFPGPVNAGGPGPGFPGFDPSVSLVNPWPRPVLDPRRPDFQPMIPQYAPNMGVHPSAMPSSIAMHPQGYGMPPPHPSAPHMSNPAPGNMDQFTTWGPYSALTLRPPGNQHDRGTSGAHRRPYNNQRRGRRQQSRSAPPPKRLDNMNDGRPEPKEPSELSVKLDCKICMTQLIDTAVFPCGHAALCRWCADLQIPPDRLNSSKPVNCPVCRGPVERKAFSLIPQYRRSIGRLLVDRVSPSPSSSAANVARYSASSSLSNNKRPCSSESAYDDHNIKALSTHPRSPKGRRKGSHPSRTSIGVGVRQMSHNGSGLGSDNLPGKPVDVVDSGDGLSGSKENQAPDLQQKITTSSPLPGSADSQRALHSNPEKNHDENDSNNRHSHHHYHQHAVRPRLSRDTSRGGTSDGTQRPAGTGSGGTEPHGIFRQLETHIIPEDQLVNEVRGIYAGLVMVEKKCIEIDKQQSESPHELSHLQWQALIALHRTLLHEHHDFFLASQHPSASPVLKRLSEKYAMPARMWRYGIHSFLELLRHRLPGSLEHTLTFLYLAYSMMTLLLESVPAFEDTWIECLGDLARYRMAVEESDMRDREAWAGVARYWYHQAADKNPSVGRIQHHLAVLARPDMFQQLFYYTKSLVSLHSFPSAGESILLLFQPLLNSPKPYNQPVVASAFVTAHGVLFTHGPITKFKTLMQEYLSHLDMYIGRLGAAFRLHGAYMASSNFAAVFQYGLPDAVLPSEFKQDTAQQPQSYLSASENWTPVENLDTIEADFVALQDSQSTQLVYYAVHLAFQTFSVILDQVGNKNVHPAVHTYLAFTWCMALNHASIRLIEVVVPWRKLTTFLNTMIHSSTDFPRMEGDELPIPEDRKQLPEDFLIRGQIWSQQYFPADFFDKSLPDDDGRSIEVPSLALSRMYRCLWLGVRLSMFKRWITYSSDTRNFSVTPFALELEKIALRLDPLIDLGASSDMEMQDS